MGVRVSKSPKEGDFWGFSRKGIPSREGDLLGIGISWAHSSSSISPLGLKCSVRSLRATQGRHFPAGGLAKGGLG